MSYTQKIVHRGSRFRRHKHGGKRIPNFVRPEERMARSRPLTTVWFGSVREAFARTRGKVAA
jgi:hypothetical protein